MQTGDSRQSGFNAERFRDGIRFAMRMGLPDTPTERVTFQWNPDEDFAIADVRQKPYDFSVSPTSSVTVDDAVTSLSLPVAVEFFDSKSSSGETPLGDMDIARVKITILDEEYDSLVDDNLGLPDKVTVDGNDYTVDYFAPPVGMFDVTVYTAYCSAVDES